jgi:hypothetical protein
MYRPDGDYLSSYKTFLFGVMRALRSSYGSARLVTARAVVGCGLPGQFDAPASCTSLCLAAPDGCTYGYAERPRIPGVGHVRGIPTELNPYVPDLRIYRWFDRAL